MIKRFRVHDWVKFDYSEIEEYIGEGYTDKPLRNDEIVDLLNQLCEENEWLKIGNKQLYHSMDRKDVRCREFKDKVFQTIDDYINKYTFEEDYCKFNGEINKMNEYYIKAMDLRLLKEELMNYV